jgi:hypothetical protein
MHCAAAVLAIVEHNWSNGPDSTTSRKKGICFMDRYFVQRHCGAVQYLIGTWPEREIL